VDHVPTDRRAVIRVLLKKAETSTGQRRIAGYTVILVGEAQEKDWAGAPFQPGDIEAFLWTTPRQVEQVVGVLMTAEPVRWVKASG
jgi:phage-related protein